MCKGVGCGSDREHCNACFPRPVVPKGWRLTGEYRMPLPSEKFAIFSRGGFVGTEGVVLRSPCKRWIIVPAETWVKVSTESTIQPSGRTRITTIIEVLQ